MSEEINPELKAELDKIVKPFVEAKMSESYSFKIFQDNHKKDMSEYLQGSYQYFYKSMTEMNQHTINVLLQLAFIDGMLHIAESFPDVINKIIEIVKAQQGE